VSAPENDIERMLSALLEPVDPEKLRALIGGRQSLIALLPEQERNRIGELLRSHRWRLSMLTVGRAASELRRMRPDLAPALDGRGGREWLGRELTELRQLTRRRAV
jgi:hypothetical protein